MDSVSAAIVVVPGIIALLFVLVFAHLSRQTREPAFVAWTVGWSVYFLHYLVHIGQHTSGATPLLVYSSRVTLVLTAICIFVSIRLFREQFRIRWSDAALAIVGLAWSAYALNRSSPFDVRLGIAALLIYCGVKFYRLGRHRSSTGITLLGGSLALWSVLMLEGQLEPLIGNWLTGFGHFSSPVAAVMIGIAMVMVVSEHESRIVQENALAFSTLDVDLKKLLTPDDLRPSLERILQRLVKPVRAGKVAIYISEAWRGVLPCAQIGFDADFLNALSSNDAGESLSQVAYRRGGLAVLHDVTDFRDPLPGRSPEALEACRQAFLKRGFQSITVVSLQSRERSFGCIIFPHSDTRVFGTAQVRLLIALAMQIATTLDNYVLMHDSQRRTREYQLLTHIGQVISSRLDPDEVLRAIHNELGHIFENGTFYIAFQDVDTVTFEFEAVRGVVQPKRSRKATNSVTEYVIRTGQPLLIRSDMESARARMGLPPSNRPAKSYIGVPIFMNGKVAGVLGAVDREREYAYEQRDLEVLQTAAGQLAVAMENARLFSEEQRRSRHLSMLHDVSKTAISTQDAEQMLGEIVNQIQSNFAFDYIGIGILDYTDKEIQIKAQAATPEVEAGKRFRLGEKIIGRVARASEALLVKQPSDLQAAVLPDAKAVFCLPIVYGETLLGVLNLESRREDVFDGQEQLILRTLTDLLATALHNSFVFQKMQQQAITDGLTGIKTRRFFLESLGSEWRRASRSGRPFSVVMIDLDKFKEVNDSLGHLEGDLVLARVGRLLEQKSRQSNIVARYGGDEFVILMPETGVEQAQILSERLRLWLANDPMLNERGITGSFGVASFPLHGSTVEDILRVADAGMYVSKHAGGNRVSTVEEFTDGENIALQRQLVAAYVEGFLQREQSGPEDAEELVSTLHKLCSSIPGSDGASALRDAVRALARAAESRETYAGNHGEDVARYSEIIGRELQLSPEVLSDLVFAARMHDVGKIVLPEKLLNKPGTLSEDEFYLLKVHAIVGAQIADTIPGGTHISSYVRHHHERIDGKGYPDGIAGEKIPMGARILAVSDAYTSMTLDRPFAPAKTREQAIAELQDNAGTQFDSTVVEALVRHLRNSRVHLSA
jgi:diguanylate cyclase (GGDEF)-like protein